MHGAVEAVSGGISRFVQSWLLPSIIAIGLAVFLLAPALDDSRMYQRVADFSGAERAALFLLGALTLALLLSSVATPLYRVLEGYQLPRKFAAKKRARHAAARDRLREEIGASTDDTALQRGVDREKLDRYPRASRYVMATRLGNALKAGESYGRTQYGLDTVLLWAQLVSVAGDSLKDGLTRTRTTMDFYAGIFWLSPLFAAASVGAAVYARDAVYLFGVLAMGLCPIAYAGTVRSATNYAAVMRALVDMTRLDLADKLGLQLPHTLAEERKLWEAYSEFAGWGHAWVGAPEWIATIDRARIKPPPG